MAIEPEGLVAIKSQWNTMGRTVLTILHPDSGVIWTILTMKMHLSVPYKENNKFSHRLLCKG